jgi:hypothetical protein
MATFTIKTRHHGVKSFHVADRGGYVRLENNQGEGQQICEDGSFHGNTLTADSDTLEVVARKWWRKCLYNEAHC